MKITIDIDNYSYEKELTPMTIKAMLRGLTFTEVSSLEGGEIYAEASYRSRYIRCPECGRTWVRTAGGVPTRHRPCDP